MKKMIIIVWLSIFVLGCQQETPDTTSKEDQNTGNEHLLMATAWYQKSAELDACYYQAFNYAKLALEKQIATDSSEKPNAIILDIDETLLDNSPFQVKMIETGKQYSPEFWKEWTDRAEAEALPGAVDFLNFADTSDVDIFYISNRMENELEATVKNMEALNFPETNPDHFLLKTTTSHKTKRRNQIKEDYNVLLLVGDNLDDYSDFLENRGKNLGKTKLADMKDILGTEFIILPNPMYGSWVDALQKQSGIDDYSEFIDQLISQLDTW
ncbi:MAG: 5'-nucleotidase, lipoprotein e(P4) family [Bacteroidota bacterium]